MASNINPNNIDGAYPVAGQDNNSQGFRDNFTNIKTNFQYTEDEINDLQNKAVLKAALVGQSLDNNMNDALIYAAKIQDFSATSVPISTTTGTITINYVSGHYQTVTTAGSITLAFQQFPAAGNYGLLKLQINITNVAHTVTLPAAVSLGIAGIQGISPGTSGVSNTITFAATGKYEFAFGTNDGGSTITVFDLNRALTNFSAADLTLDDLTASGFVSAAGNVTGGNLVTTGLVTATGNLVGGNLVTSGNVVTTNTFVGGNFLGGTNGSMIVPGASGLIQAANIVGNVNLSSSNGSAPPLKFTTGSNTSPAAAGGLEFDGEAFYASIDSDQRAAVSLEHFRCVQSSPGDIALTNSATAQAVFGSTDDSITLAANTTYFLEALYVVGPGTGTNLNAVTMSTVFAVTSALTSLRYTADTAVGLASDVNDTKRKLVTAPTASVVTDAAAGGNESYFTVMLKGVLVTNAATTVTPQIAFSGSPAATSLRTLVGSYLRLSPVGSSTVAAVGNWS